MRENVHNGDAAAAAGSVLRIPVNIVNTESTSSSQGGLTSTRKDHNMITQLIDVLSEAFESVVGLVGGGVNGVFGAVESLSSNIF